MTKAEIIEAVYEKVGGVSKKEAAELVESVFQLMKDALIEGEQVKISRFGNFEVKSKSQWMGRNPHTGEPMPIGARKKLGFRRSQILFDILNPDRGEKTKVGETPAPAGANDVGSGDIGSGGVH